MFNATQIVAKEQEIIRTARCLRNKKRERAYDCTQIQTKRGGGRAGNAGRRGGSSILQLPWHLTTNIDMPTEPLNEEGVTAIHLGAMEILEEIGLEILNQKLGIY